MRSARRRVPVKAGPFFTVPAGAAPSKCRTCAAAIYWIITPLGKKMPVDCAGDDGCQPPSVPARGSNAADGLGISHFATCGQADLHRRAR